MSQRTMRASTTTQTHNINLQRSKSSPSIGKGVATTSTSTSLQDEAEEVIHSSQRPSSSTLRSTVFESDSNVTIINVDEEIPFPSEEDIKYKKTRMENLLIKRTGVKVTFTH